jgi:hypothetical protein
MNTPGVPKKKIITNKIKKFSTSSHKHEIACILSLVLPPIKSLEHLSLFYFGFNVEHIFYSLLDLGLHSNDHLMVMDVLYYP